VVLHQVLLPYFDLSFLYPRPSSTSRRREYLQANHLVQPQVLAEAGHRKVGEAAQGAEEDRRLSEAWVVVEEVLSPGALVEE
jgi:hypothetical protein